MSFPTNPTNNQMINERGIIYKYNSSNNKWNKIGYGYIAPNAYETPKIFRDKIQSGWVVECQPMDPTHDNTITIKYYNYFTIVNFYPHIFNQISINDNLYNRLKIPEILTTNDCVLTFRVLEYTKSATTTDDQITLQPDYNNTNINYDITLQETANGNTSYTTLINYTEDVNVALEIGKCSF